MREPAFWYRPPSLLSRLLAPLGAIYGAIAAQRMSRAGASAGIPVLCVGNYHLGGAGKTPTTLALVKLLRELGEQPFVVSRGYGGTQQGPLRVDPASHSAADVGDEPLMLASNVSVIVSRDRVAGASLARTSGASVVLLDDGFQNPALAKDASLIVIDAARGIGNGISLIILAGIVAELPSAIAGTLELGRQGALSTFLILAIIIMAVAVIMLIVFVERAQRRLLIQYPKRQVGNKMFEGQSSHLPLKLNTAGVIPPIFASSLLLLPTTIASFNAGKGPEWFQWLTTQLSHGRPLFLVLYLAMIVFFAFFYTAIVFNPTETADNLKKHGGFIPGIRPGERTAEYIDYVLSRITVIGAIYLAVVCLIPEILISYASVPFYLGGTSLLIVVSVTMDTVAQVQGYLLAHQYEGLIRKSKLRGRRK